ncbi:uncharacterized protein [Miscanthus floridulus]|uniref:uncharacterized protein isoform X3 n=1 Tax=Miscanthus floridulus TaxID=154761 RepID=UPI003458ABC0
MGGGWGAVEAEGVASPRRIRRRRVRCRVAPKVIPVATAPARSSRGGFGLPPTSPPPSPARLDRRRKPRPHSPTARVIQDARTPNLLPAAPLAGDGRALLGIQHPTRSHWCPRRLPRAGPHRDARAGQDAEEDGECRRLLLRYFLTPSTLTAVLRCTLLPVRATVTVSEWLLNWKTNIDVHDRWGSTVILVVGDDTQHISRGILYDKAIQRIGQRLQDQGRSS